MNIYELYESSDRMGQFYDRLEKHSLYNEINELREESITNSQVIAEVQESLLAIADAFDNYGYKELGKDEAHEMPLDTVKKMAHISRGMATLNPFVKRGVSARISYIWGKGVQFDNVDSIQDKIERHYDKLFSSQAKEERERAAATDGNVFTAISVDEAESDYVFRIPLNEITGVVSNPEDSEDIWYYRRTRTEKKVNLNTGQETTKEIIKYYPSIDYYTRVRDEGRTLPTRIQKHAVDHDYVILHDSVNKQVGWRWGTPDIAPVVFWARAYKEYLEDQASLVKAYNRIAWQARGGSANALDALGARMRKTPTRDPITGEMRDVGGTFTSGGVELNAMPPNGSNVNFDNGSALASAIAAGLELPKTIITSDPGSGNRATAETLDLPTLKAMETRQELWKASYTKLFKFWGAENPIITFPQIKSDSTKDRISALGVADELGILYPEEVRKEMLETFGIAPFKPWDELPNPGDDVRKKYEEEKAEKAFERQQQRAEDAADEQQSVIPAQGKSGGIAAKGGALSSNNQSRDNRKEDTGNR